MNLYTQIKTIAIATNAINVGFSTGKDSIVTLDLCCRFIKTVRPFFMYFVPGLEFQERYLRYIEERYKIEIIRLPHWHVSEMLKGQTYRPKSNISEACPIIKISDIEAEIRSKTGIAWFAYGQKVSDSLERNAMLRRCRGVDLKTRRSFPVMNFSDKAIFAYMRQNRLRLPRDYELWGSSFGRLWAPELIAIKERYPEDYERIKNYFPHVESAVKRFEFSLKSIPKI